MKRKKILLVEDEIIIAMNEANLLIENGYDVIMATSGKKAIERIGNTPDISLILMDIDLGKGIDGTETAKIILEYKNIPIVFLTSHVEKDVISKVKEITRYGYIIKGSNDFVLLSSIEMAYELFDSHQKTKESEQRFKSLFHKHNAIMLLIKPDSGEIVDANLSAEKFYGYSLNKLKEMNIYQINTLDIKLIQEERLRAEKEERNYFIFPHKLSNGEIRTVEVHSSPISMENETVLFSIIHDITDREKTAKALNESEKLYRLLAENSNDVIWTMNLNWEFMYVSPSVFQLRGFTPEEVKKQKPEEVISPNSLPLIQEAFSRMLLNVENDTVKKHETDYFQVEQPCKDGSTVMTEATARLAQDEDGNFIVVGITRDITKRKEVEDRIKTLLNEKDLLLKEVHHRIKNNMATIGSLLSLQASTIKDPEASKALKESRDRVKTMSDIYDKLYKTTEYNNLNIKEYLSNIIQDISDSYNFTNKVTIRKDIQDFDIDTKIAFPMGVIITELITNSLKYAFPNNSSGIIDISIYLSDPNNAVLSVSDNGIGMPEHIIRNRDFGFGLNLVDILSQQIDGSFDISNNNGSKFNIKFPLIS
jgi:PAS domain S-box-containing protein